MRILSHGYDTHKTIHMDTTRTNIHMDTTRTKPYIKLNFESLKSIECVLLWTRRRRGVVKAEEEEEEVHAPVGVRSIDNGV
jgi:hypothetical protein